ncbi:hypothetical protein ACJRO7_014631 [Eucalyptus globulus]|uniref:Uncharacterized protein n=1 Tax=Eucalyptus globulus TaxID=34317 RepID=A0ABD3L1I4_EUCGL
MTLWAVEQIITDVLGESEDISFRLLSPLLASVFKENKKVAPLCWKLRDRVITSCAAKLGPLLWGAVQSIGTTVDDYSPVVASVAYGVVCSPGEVVPELDSAPTSNTSDAAVLLFPNDIVPVAKTSTKKAHSADFKASKLMNPDEGYDLSWLYAERQKYGRIRVLGNGHNLSAAYKVPSKMRRMQQITVARDEEAPVLVDIAGKKSKLLVVGGKMSNYNNAVLQDAGVLAEGLVGLRIKAWWPFDEMFYDGLIQSYDPLTKKRKDMVILPYKDSLLLFSWYLQQFDLDGNRVNQGLTVYGNKGSTDQHAYKQQLREGVHNFFVTFIEVLCERPPGHDWELEPSVTCGDYLFGMLQGTGYALYANDRESITVTVEEVTPRSVGALIALIWKKIWQQNMIIYQLESKIRELRQVIKSLIMQYTQLILCSQHDSNNLDICCSVYHAVEEKDEFLTPANEEESIVSSEPIVDAETKGDDASENADELSKEELGQLVASRWTGEKTEKESGEDFARDNNNEEQSREIPKDTRDGIDDIYALETADSEKNEYDNVEDAFDEDSAVNDHYDFSSHYKDGSVSDSDDELDFEGSVLRLPVNLNILF